MNPVLKCKCHYCDSELKIAAHHIYAGEGNIGKQLRGIEIEVHGTCQCDKNLEEDNG